MRVCPIICRDLARYFIRRVTHHRMYTRGGWPRGSADWKSSWFYARPRGFEPLTFAFGGKRPLLSKGFPPLLAVTKLLVHTEFLDYTGWLAYLEFAVSCRPLCSPPAYPRRGSSMKLTKRTVAGVKPDPTCDVFAWDEVLQGFGLRVKPTGVRTFQRRQPPLLFRKIRRLDGRRSAHLGQARAGGCD